MYRFTNPSRLCLGDPLNPPRHARIAKLASVPCNDHAMTHAWDRLTKEGDCARCASGKYQIGVGLIVASLQEPQRAWRASPGRTPPRPVQSVALTRFGL